MGRKSESILLLGLGGVGYSFQHASTAHGSGAMLAAMDTNLFAGTGMHCVL